MLTFHNVRKEHPLSSDGVGGWRLSGMCYAPRLGFSNGGDVSAGQAHEALRTLRNIIQAMCSGGFGNMNDKWRSGFALEGSSV